MDFEEVPPLSHKKLAIILLVGSVLLVTPFLLRFSRGVEKSIFSAMATLTDVKETLDEKLILLSDLYLNLEGTQGAQSKVKLEKAEKHFAYSKDVYQLASTFIEASSKRYPKYGTFWSRYRERLAATWKEIDGVYGKIRAAAGSVEADGESLRTAATPSASAAPAPSAVTRSSVAPAPSVPSAASSAPAPSAPAPSVRPAPAAAPAPVAVAVAPRPAPRAVTPPAARKPASELGQQEVLEMYREGYQCFARSDEKSLERGAGLFREILAAQPSFHLARYWLSKTYVLQKKIDEAKVEAERLHRDQPNLQIAKDLLREVENIAAMQARAAGAPASSAPAAAPRVALRPASSPAPVAALPAPSPRPVPAARPVAPSRPVVASLPVGAPERPRIGRIRSLDGDAPQLASPVITAGGPPLGRDALRPVAIMVENSRRARPQSGLQEADVVYEIPVEGGITRFMAVYRDPRSDVGPIGPVRSCRPYFVENLNLFDAVYTHCGASTEGYVRIREHKVDDIDEIRVGSGFWRSRKRRAPHNLYTDLKGIRGVIDQKGYRKTTRVNGEVFDRSGSVTRSFQSEYVTIDVPYHRAYAVSYRYDPLSNRYARQINGKDHLDGETGKVLEADNVVIRHAEMEKLDAAGRLRVEMVGSGRCTLLVGGRILQGSWMRDDFARPVRYRDAKGRPIALNPGNVWVQVVPDESRIAVRRQPLGPAESARLARLEASLSNGMLLAKEKAQVVSPRSSEFGAASLPRPAVAVRPAPRAVDPARSFVSPEDAEETDVLRAEAYQALAPSPRAVPALPGLRPEAPARVALPSSNPIFASRAAAAPVSPAPMTARVEAPARPAAQAAPEKAPWLADTDVVDFDLDSF